MIRPQINNQLAQLLESLKELQRDFRELPLGEKQDFLVFLSRMIRLTKDRTRKKTLARLRKSLESEAIKSLDGWLDAEMKN